MWTWQKKYWPLGTLYYALPPNDLGGREREREAQKERERTCEMKETPKFSVIEIAEEKK